MEDSLMEEVEQKFQIVKNPDSAVSIEQEQHPQSPTTTTQTSQQDQPQLSPTQHQQQQHHQQQQQLFNNSILSTSATEVRLTDEEFMEVIRDFPGVYDKNHEVFRDKGETIRLRFPPYSTLTLTILKIIILIICSFSAHLSWRL